MKKPNYPPMAQRMLNQSDIEHAEVVRKLNSAISRIPLAPLPLPVCVPPFQQESLLSVVFRASEKMGLKSPYEFLIRLGWKLNEIPRPNQISQLGKSIGINPRLLAASSPITFDNKELFFYRHRLQRNHVVPSDRRICPECVFQTGYGHRVWQLRALTVCPIHRKPLVDRCSDCQSPLSIHRQTYDKCNCEKGYTATSDVVSDAAIHLAALIVAKFNGEDLAVHARRLGIAPDVINGMPLAGLLDLVAVMGLAQRDPAKFQLRRIDWPVDSQIGMRHFEMSAKALTSWPNGFFERLRSLRMYQPWQESAVEVSKTLDHISRAATHHMQTDAGRFVLKGIAAFISRPSEWNEHRKQAAAEGLECSAS